MKLIGYTSEKGLFFACKDRDYSGRNTLDLKKHRFNGKIATPTHHKSWYFLEGGESIKEVQLKTYGGYCNTRWELISEDLFIEGKIPLIISPEEACEGQDEDYEWGFGIDSLYRSKAALYKRVQDRAEDYFKDVEFTIDIQGNVKFKDTQLDLDPIPFYSVYKTQWKHEGERILVLDQIASYDELSEMLTSDLLIHNRPCSLSSEQTYKIVRKHILDNIKSKYATVTSDYDFCFTVKKKISIKPIHTKTEITKKNGRSYAKPRFTNHSKSHKELEIFEMTHNGRKYKGYTVIKGFKGESLSDLAENIRLYLEELIEYINKPLHECQECGGFGSIFDEYLDKNKRD